MGCTEMHALHVDYGLSIVDRRWTIILCGLWIVNFLASIGAVSVVTNRKWNSALKISWEVRVHYGVRTYSTLD